MGDFIMEEKINLSDIKNIELVNLIDEYLFGEGIVVYDLHQKDFFEICTFGTNYMVMYDKDIDIYFEDSNDPDFPIKMSYETIYTNSIVTLDYILQDLFDERFDN
jgi:hypothetical protein